MKLGKSLFIFGLAAFIGTAAFAGDLLELRVGAGIAGAETNSFRAGSVVNSDNIDLNDMTSYNADLIFNTPLFPINAGIRYEKFGADDNNTFAGVNYDTDLDVEVISLLVDWRILDNVVYVGPLVGIGTASAEYDINYTGGNTTFDLDPDGLSYLIGLEGGVHLGKFIVGAEVGYQNINLENNVSVDLSGAYGKVLVGLSFL